MSALSRVIGASFMGRAPGAYKLALLLMLIANVLLLRVGGPLAASWAIVCEFILTLVLSLACYPLAPAGILALQALLLGLTTPARIYQETERGLSMLLLLIFMVTAVGLLRELLVLMFSRVLLHVRSQPLLALLFCASGALLSAFLDALTVVAVIMTVVLGVYSAYRRLAPEASEAELRELRAALRSLLMHAAVGTALGGVCTLVGEPQNLLIGEALHWDFKSFLLHVAPVSLPVLATGLGTTLALEHWGYFGFGAPVPAPVRERLIALARAHREQRTVGERWRLGVQAACGLLLIGALAAHLAEPGLIGLSLIVLLALLLGIDDERALEEAFKTTMPFTALLLVFFAIIAVIDERQLFAPVMQLVLSQHGRAQTAWLYLANGALSAVSDNVFVAGAYLGEIRRAFDSGAIDGAQYARLAVAINTGTNIPSIATPNGQAALLFLLTSPLAAVVELSYRRMCWMTLPYVVTTTTVGLLACIWLLR
jgi:NhaB family Na+:H+ antiporter